MCSTFKWVLAAAALGRVESGMLSLDQRLAYGEGDLLEYAPVTREHVAAGFMTVDALLQAAVKVSDNTAANLLLRPIGGPTGLTHFIKANGDSVTRLDRDEPMLNANQPGDPRDRVPAAEIWTSRLPRAAQKVDVVGCERTEFDDRVPVRRRARDVTLQGSC